ncbi:MAG: FadR family transcriptional regulator [Hyphomicrobiales bacterium]
MKIDTKPKQNLTQKVKSILRQKLENQELLPGDKLPTEQKLINEFGVSRTVIREAISGLKADGLLVSIQGSGVFVLETDKQKNSIDLPHSNIKTISSVIEALELRDAVETRSAELAARRCSPIQEAEIYARFSDFKRKVMAGDTSEKEDFAFHVAIAKASNNEQFVDFLTLIGRNIIPRSQLRIEANLQLDPNYEKRILQEHEEILMAIINNDSEAARIAMHSHLSKSADQYKKLIRLARNS